ncbi:MAG: hypothetical protein WC554_18790 [Clostridia bacterium]|jgi:hypothetical protein
MTNWELANEIIARGRHCLNLLTDIKKIKGELQISLDEFDIQMKEIENKKWEYFICKGEKYLYRIFKKYDLLNFNTRFKIDCDTLIKYRDTLIDINYLKERR